MQDFRNFSENRLHTLFSKERIASYISINQHFDNFRLVAQISENLGIAEVLLRNKIDSIMCGLDSTWLDNLPSDIKIDKPTNEPNPTHDKLVSIQILGFWVRVAEFYKIEGKIFGVEFLNRLDFKRYYTKNMNRFRDKANLQNYQKANLFIRLLHNLRNRAFHFENLYKLNNNNQPRLNACITNDNKTSICIINLKSTRIKIFLNDFIDELSK